MYPVLFRLGSFDITSFGAMVALGAVFGILLLRSEMVRSGLDGGKGIDAALVGVLGGLAGAKLLYVVEHWAEPLSDTLLSRGGMSWFGGLTGGVVAGLVMVAYARLPLMTVLSAAAPALAVGQAVGRIGCFLVGDDYGRPTSLPWGIAFPQGLPPTMDRVHPTQLYEFTLLLGIAGVLMWLRRRGTADRAVVAWYLVLAGGMRFLIELVRVNQVVVAGLTTAQLFSVAMVLFGVGLVVKKSRVPVARKAERQAGRQARR
jgi:phosphatidylglycerol:prolipoprotein diacylglycerol transferase